MFVPSRKMFRFLSRREDNMKETCKIAWDKYFHSAEPDGYAQGAHMDLSLIVPLVKKAEQRQ